MSRNSEAPRVASLALPVRGIGLFADQAVGAAVTSPSAERRHHAITPDKE